MRAEYGFDPPPKMTIIPLLERRTEGGADAVGVVCVRGVLLLAPMVPLLCEWRAQHIH